MPTFQNPVSDADAAHEALRGLAHATRTFNDPAQTYDVIGNLIAAVRSLHQVLDQVAAAHLAHRDWACTDDGDSVAGAAHAERAANALHDAAQYPAVSKTIWISRPGIRGESRVTHPSHQRTLIARKSMTSLEPGSKLLPRTLASFRSSRGEGYRFDQRK